MNNEFRKKVDQRQVRIGIIGLGYVGLPLVLAFANEGFPTTGFDIDAEKVELLMTGRTYLKQLPEKAIIAANEAGNFKATSDFSLLGEVDIIIICVPTPLTVNREPDMQYIITTGEMIYPHFKPLFSSIGRSTSSVVPGKVVDSRITICSRLRCG